MVHLILSSLKGNQGLRYFPFTGYLGLTPVRVEGFVRTRLDDDAKQLHAKSITISVRCYESRIGRVSVLHSNVLADFTQVLWSKPDGQDYAPIEDLEFPFRITIPTKVAGFSTAVFVDYRCMWRVEAVLNHAPISGVGSRQVKHFELPLIRFDLPPHQPTPSAPLRHHLQQRTTKPKAPRLRYYINAPTTPIGPLDIVSIPVYLLPMEDGIFIRSATVMIERRIKLYETTGNAFPPDTLISPQPVASSSKYSSSRTSPSSSPSSQSDSPSSSYQEPSHARFNGVATIASDNSSDPTITPLSSDSDRPLLSSSYSYTSPPSSSPSQMSSKTITTPILGAESSGQFVRDAQGVWSKTVTLQWPAAKTHSRWAIGESVQSELVSVKFFARVKIAVSSINGTESIELSEKELLVVSTNEAERQLAITKYNELSNNNQLGLDKTGRSKSKSPGRRSRRDREFDIPPPPPPLRGPGIYSGSNSTGSVAGSGNGQESSGGGKVMTPRRPHTSAGPRDNKAFAGGGYGLDVLPLGGEDTFRRRKADTRNSGGSGGTVRPETSQGRTSKRRSGMVGNFFASAAPRISNAVSGSSESTTSRSGSGSGSVSRSTTASSVSSRSGGGRDVGGEEKVREWEEELVKIEMLSRQSSDMLGFAGKRKRFAGTPRAVEPGISESDV